MADDEQGNKVPVKRVRRLKGVAEDKPWSMPAWFDEVPAPWEQAWSDDDTPIGCQLAREMAQRIAKQ